MVPCYELGSLDSFAEDTVSKVHCGPFFVVHSGTNFIVYLGMSTHMPNEPLEWDSEQRLFISRFHGESFDIYGQVVSGPAQGPLMLCPTRVRDGVLELNVPVETPDEHLQEFCDLPAGSGMRSP